MTKEPMTIESYDLLVEEFKYLLEVEKPETAKEKLIAAAQGDRSENADYHAAKEKLRFIDKRLFFLDSMIQKAQIIDPSMFKHDKVSFGSSVTIYNIKTKQEERYTICGVLESEPEQGLISMSSPLAKAMLNNETDDDFYVKLPNETKHYEIVSIEYKDIYSLKKNKRTKDKFGFH